MKVARSIIAAVLAVASPALTAAPEPRQAQQANVATAEKDGFGVVQLASVDADRFLAEWRRSAGDVTVTTDSVVVRNVPIHTYILFKGCTAAQNGNCHVTAEYWVFDPAGKLYGYTKGLPLWSSVKPTGRAHAMGENKMDMRVESGERLGPYTIRFHTTDEVAHITVETEAIVTVSESPAATR